MLFILYCIGSILVFCSAVYASNCPITVEGNKRQKMTFPFIILGLILVFGSFIGYTLPLWK